MVRRYISGIVCVLQVLLLFQAGCKKKDDSFQPTSEGPAGIVVSGIVHTLNGTGIEGASVQLYNGNRRDGDPAATALTDRNGKWQITFPLGGRFTAVIARTSYPVAVLAVDVPADQPTFQVRTVVLAEAYVHGLVTSAESGVPIRRSRISVLAGDGMDTSGVTVTSASTDLLGQWSIPVTLGKYVLIVSVTGRLPLISSFVLTDTESVFHSFSLVQPPSDGSVRIVLNWNARPEDLDVHLTGPGYSGTRFHLYFGRPVVLDSSGDTVATLDHDATPSYGPETITIRKFSPGEYRFAVHDYRWIIRESPIAFSITTDAAVHVYSSIGQIFSATIPPDKPGNAWFVFRIDGTTRGITAMNTFADSVSYNDAAKFSTARNTFVRDW